MVQIRTRTEPEGTENSEKFINERFGNHSNPVTGKSDEYVETTRK